MRYSAAKCDLGLESDVTTRPHSCPVIKIGRLYHGAVSSVTEYPLLKI
jgi:hypothetical protein